MGNLLGEKKTLKQIIREQKRINNRSIRELDRELNKLKREQTKAENEMRRLARQGQMQAVKHLAKDIIRMKDSQTKFIKLKAELRSLSVQMETMAAQQQMQTAIKNVSRTLTMVAGQINLTELQQSLQTYAMKSEEMEMKQEMMGDALDDAMAIDSDEEDELVAKVMDDLGLQFRDELVDAPGEKQQQKASQEDKVDADLQARLDNLKR